VLMHRPWRTRALAGRLGVLQQRIHEVVVEPGAVRPGPVPGDRLLHLDFHPENVILAPGGPVVIDWDNAAVGDPRADLAMTWIIMATSELDAPRPLAPVVDAIRRRFVARWLDTIDHAGAATALAVVGELRIGDSNVRPSEAARVRQLVERAATS
jgi:thiamine kinase-like enzyme